MTSSKDKAFDALKKPFIFRQKKSTLAIWLVWLLIVLLPGIVSGWSYLYSKYTNLFVIYSFILFIIAYKVYKQAKNNMQILQPCDEYLLINHVDKIILITKTIKNLRAVLNIKKDIIFSVTGEIEGRNASVNLYRNCYCIQFSLEMLYTDNDELVGIIGHEIGHIANGDLDVKLFLNLLQLFITPTMFLHFSVISITSIYFLIPLLFAWILLNRIEFYFFMKISRQAEYLADIWSVRHTKKGTSFANFFLNGSYNKVYDILRRRNVLANFLMPVTHPLPEKRVEIINKAQEIVDSE